MIPEPTEALLPCPFCGGDAHEAVGVRGDHGFAVQCGRGYCRASIRGYPTQQQAIARWNTREPEAGKLREALEECATALNSFIYIIAQRFDGDGSYYWMRGPTHDEAQAAMEANNNALTALSRNQGR